MDSLVFNIISFLITLGILVIVHEFGHFWVARTLGVRVLRFSVGFGPVIWKWVSPRDGTEYALSALPFGGYVKMLDETEGDVAAADLHRAFNRQPLWIRSAVVVAGPLFNLAFAVLAFWLVLVIGDTGLRPIIGDVRVESDAYLAGFKSGDEIIAIENQSTPTWDTVLFAMMAVQLENKHISIKVVDAQKTELIRWLPDSVITQSIGKPDFLELLGLSIARPELPARIGEVTPGEPADQSGLQSGDLILSADAQPIANWREWVEYVRERPERSMHVTIQRQTAVLEFDVHPRAYNEDGKMIGRIGASVDTSANLTSSYLVVVHMDPWDAFVASAKKTLYLCQIMLSEIKQMFMGQGQLDNLSGPISIAQFAGKAASYGLNQFLKFLASISISLGVLNLLPVPILDGGHLLFFLIEGLAGRPLPLWVQTQLLYVGATLLLLLTIIVLRMDVIRLLG